MVVDCHSTDKTASVAKKSSNKLPKFTILEDAIKGVSSQRNLGAHQATGEYLIFMDADNRLPEAFLLGLRYRIHVSNPDLFTTWCLPDSDKSGDKTLSTAINIAIETTKAIEFENALGALIGCRRSIFTSIGEFSPKIVYGEDGEFIRRATRKGFIFKVFRDPRFVYSLRRFRREGSLQATQKYANLFLRQFMGVKIRPQDYPMGGDVKVDGSLSPIFPSWQKINQKTKNKSKLLESLRQLLSEE